MTAAEFTAKVKRLRVLIVGDVCLDRWCSYDPSLCEPSAETGIPRIAVTHVECSPGAAGTVATNLRSLGVGRVSVLGIVGADGHGHELEQALNALNIEAGLLVHDARLPTFTYTKLINQATGAEDQARVDFVFTGQMPEEVDTEIARRLRDSAQDFDVICVSDQAETERGGVVTPKVRSVLEEIASGGKLVFVDSRKRIELFRRCVLKANEAEAREALSRAHCETLSALREQAGAPLFFVTYGGKMVLIAGPTGERRVETRRIPNPVDICGAGDSFTSGASCALALDADVETAARMGHLVASVTIMKKGTGSASPAELMEAEQQLTR